ncbi:MAG: serine/threonine-protein phosphatase [bacterium]|nr:serine/threonine-protein phosphatase [bacterium]
MRIDSYLYTHCGGQSHNEDCAASRTDAGSSLFVLADGLGGCLGGEEASRHVVETILAAWEQYQKGNGRQEETPTYRNYMETCMAECILKANTSLIQLQKALHKRMKSTVVTLAVQKDSAVWANVGDSRLYYLTQGHIFQLTQDHSVTYKKYQSGEISKAQIARDEDRSSLLRVVGDAKRCIPDCGTLEFPLRSGDAFLLCSDGFWEYLSEEEILIERLKAETAKEWIEGMMLRLMERILPDTDNLTALTVIFTAEDAKED